MDATPLLLRSPSTPASRAFWRLAVEVDKLRPPIADGQPDRAAGDLVAKEAIAETALTDSPGAEPTPAIDELAEWVEKGLAAGRLSAADLESLIRTLRERARAGSVLANIPADGARSVEGFRSAARIAALFGTQQSLRDSVAW